MAAPKKDTGYEMAKYRVNKKSFIGHTIIEEGGEIEFDGEPGSNLDPLDKTADRNIEKAAKARAIRAGKGTDGLDTADARLLRTGRDLESPFDAANPRPAEGEGKRGSHKGKPATPTADRPGDPQPEVGPTEDEVDGEDATDKAHKDTERAKAGPKVPQPKPPGVGGEDDEV